jgi:predicted dithiol-disulfide oxidoreductase (DUF899 family)
MTNHTIGTRAQWDAARADLLEREKEHTRVGDELKRRRGELPWLAVEKQYTLQTFDGPKTAAELAGNSSCGYGPTSSPPLSGGSSTTS